jgi:copper/silver efflux system protein
VLCSLLLRGKFHKEDDNPVMRVLQRIYRPALTAALAHRAITVTIAATLFLGALILARGIGSEFMPPLNEGDLMFMPIADPSISIEENTKNAAKQNQILQSFPEVEYAVAKVARADTSTDPAPLNMTETVVHLRPRDQWRAGMTLERLRAEMSSAAQLPGVSPIWTMPIINRIDMLTTGIRSEVGVKIFGDDLAGGTRAACSAGRSGGQCGARVEQRLPGASHQRTVFEHRGRPGGRCALRHRCRRGPAGHRDRRG